ncbi:SEL1-like repeat protein [Candidatus Dependentiae bacterium]|nr:SEL1-like repeat protein [Candidatus Dependentiae bacterium]
MNMIGRIITSVILLLSLTEIFIPYTILASEISLQSRSKQARKESDNLSAKPLDTLLPDLLTHVTLKSSGKLLDHTSKSIKMTCSSSLMNDLISVTGAQPDLRLYGYHRLREILEHNIFLSEQDPGGLRGQWNSLWTHHLKPPENLLVKNNIKKFLASPNSPLLEEHHDIFAFFNSTYKALTVYEHNLCSYITNNNINTVSLNTIKNIFQLINQQYKVFQTTLIELVNGYSKALHNTDKTDFFLYTQQIDAYIEPKAILITDLHSGSFYRISQEMTRHILAFDEKGNRTKPPSGQNHSVTYVPSKPVGLTGVQERHGVYFKNDGNPSLQPGREAMMYHLYSILGISTAETGLIFIDNIQLHDETIHTPPFFKQGLNIHPFCVQVSREIVGERGDSFLNRSYEELTDILDYTTYFWQTVGAFLSYPSDGKPENIIARQLKAPQDKYELISCDNDKVFEPPIIEGCINFKSVLLTLPQMDHVLPLHLKKRLATLDPALHMLEWLTALYTHNQKYRDLFKQLYEEKKRQNYGLDPDTLKKELAGFEQYTQKLWHKLSLPIEIKKQEVAIPSQVLKTIASLVRDNQHINLNSILKTVEPLIAEAYEELRKTFTNPSTCMKALYGCEIERPLHLRHLPLKKYDVLEELLERKVPRAYEYPQWDQETSSIQEEIKTVLKQAPKDILEKIIKKNLSAPKEHTFLLIALLVQAGSFKIKDIALFINFFRSCNTKEKIQLFKLVSPCLSSHPELKWRLELENLFTDSLNHTYYPYTAQEMKGVTLGIKKIPVTLYNHLFDESGIFKRGQKNNKPLPGRSSVQYYPPENPVVYFKKDPELPGYEYATTEFMRMMGIDSLPFSELTMFYDPIGKKQYPVLLSQAVPGDLVHEVWDTNDAFKDLDPHHTGLLLLAAMFINVEDGKEDNYILTPDRKKLIPIDNDHAFVPGTVWKRNEIGFRLNTWTVVGTLQTKTLLFCLDIMNKRIPDSVRSHFLNLDPDRFLKDWLQRLILINERYQSFFPDLTELYPKTILKIPLSKEYVSQLYWKMHTVQKQLKKNKDATYLDLLQIIEPYIAKTYKLALHDEGKKTVKKRFLSVTNGYYKTTPNGESRLSAANSRELMEIINIPTEDLICTASKVQTGPVSALETLQELKLERIEQKKKHQEIVQGTEELDNPIDCTRLSNHEQMTHLNRILLGSKIISGLAIHHCSVLQPEYLALQPEFQELGVSLQFLDLRGAHHLDERAFKAIYETCCNLEYLNISGWRKIWYLQHHNEVKKNLFGRELDSNQQLPQISILSALKRLVVNDCLTLENICLSLPQVTRIEANHNPRLDMMQLHNPHKTLVTVSVEECPLLSSKMAYDIIKQNQQIKSFNIKGSPLNQDCFYQRLIGNVYDDDRDYTEARKWYLKAANQGDADAHYYIGILYHNGCGVVQDYQKAMQWYLKVAEVEQGDANAPSYLRGFYDNNNDIFQNYPEARKWSLKVVERGHAAAQYYIGPHYDNRYGVVQNYTQAMKYYLQADKKGHAAAQCNIGTLYHYGCGVVQDYREAMYWYLKAAQQGHAEAQCNIGTLYHYGCGVVQDYKEAINWYLKADEQGHSGAQCNIGILYHYGCGVIQDYIKAMEWYVKAAQQGNATSEYCIGTFYHNGWGVVQNYTEAMQWYLKAANQGDADAQCNIGILYQNGCGVIQDYIKAMEWYLKAAQQGNAEAQLKIGILYHKGSGVVPDYTEAREWYVKAAQQGHADAPYYIGILYHNGSGVVKDYTKAMKWYLKADKRGSAGAPCYIGILYHYGCGVEPDYTEAREWYLKAAQQGDATSEYYIGTLYQYGCGVAQDFIQAREWYVKAAQQGNANAQWKIGTLYHYGCGVEQDYTKAREWYVKAAQQGHAGAQCNIGTLYLKGCGVEPNYTEAMNWYLKAAQQGDATSEYYIGTLYQYGCGVEPDYTEAMKWYLKAAQQGDADALIKVAELDLNNSL